MSKLYFPSYEALRQWIFTRNNVDGYSIYVQYTTFREYISNLGEDEIYTFLILVWLSENCPNIE